MSKNRPYVKLDVKSNEIKEFAEFADLAAEYAIPENIETRNDINMKMYLDDGDEGHWYIWDEYKESFGFPRTDASKRESSKRCRMKDNLLGIVLDMWVAYLVGTSPQFEVRSVNSQNEDMTQARLANRILTAAWRRLNMTDIKIRLYTLMGIFGQAFLYPYWNAKSGEQDKDGNYSGDVGISILYPHEVLPEPGVSYLDESSRLVLRRNYPANVVRRFGVEPKSLNNTRFWPGKASDRIDFRYRAFDELTPSGTGQEYVTLFDYFEKPMKGSEHGRHVVWTERLDGKKAADVLLSSELPVDYRWGFPVVEYHDRKVDGKYTAITRMEGAIPNQFMYNALLSTSMDVFARMVPGIAIPISTMQPNFSEKKDGIPISSEPGYVMTYNPANGGKPVVLQGASPHQLQMMFMENRKQAIFEHFSVTDIRPYITKGNIPATSVRYAMEQDMSRLRKLYGEVLERKDSKVGALILALYKKNAKTVRIWPEVKDFYTHQKLMFRGNNIEFSDVIVQPGTGLGLPELMVEDQIQRDIAIGVLNPRTPEGRQELRRRLAGTTTHALSPEEQQEIMAQDENARFLELAKGKSVKKPTVDYSNNDPVHVTVHWQHWASPDVQDLPDAQKKLYDELMKEHLFVHLPDLAFQFRAKMAESAKAYEDAQFVQTPDEKRQLEFTGMAMEEQAKGIFRAGIKAVAEGQRTQSIQAMMEQGKATAPPQPGVTQAVPVQNPPMEVNPTPQPGGE